MSMKRFLIIVGIAGLLGFGAPVTVQAEAGPRCADIVEGGSAYEGTGESATATVELFLAAPRCASFEYRIIVVPTDEHGVPTGEAVTSDAVSTIGPAEIIQVTLAPAPEWVCISAEVTSPGGHHAFDTAPELSTGAPACDLLPLDPNGSPGGGTTWR